MRACGAPSRLRRRRKRNYATTGSGKIGIMSHVFVISGTRVDMRILHRHNCTCALIQLPEARFPKGRHGRSREGQILAGIPDPQPDAWQGAGRVVSCRTIFRSSRSGAGQVRDAAAGTDRERVGNGGLAGVRLFANGLLPGIGIVSTGWPTRPDSRPTGTAWGAQAYQGCHEVSRRRIRARRIASNDGFGRIASPAIQTGGPSAERGAGSCPEKKGALKQVRCRDTLPIVASSDRWASRYEDLRQYAVRQDDRGGWGIALFRHRGTVAWMKAWPATEESPTAADNVPAIKEGTPVGMVEVPATLCREAILILVEMIVGQCQEDTA